MMDALFRLMFIGIVAAFREHSQLSVGKVSIEVHTLFHVKEKALVRIDVLQHLCTSKAMVKQYDRVAVSMNLIVDL